MGPEGVMLMAMLVTYGKRTNKSPSACRVDVKNAHKMHISPIN